MAEFDLANFVQRGDDYRPRQCHYYDLIFLHIISFNLEVFIKKSSQDDCREKHSYQLLITRKKAETANKSSFLVPIKKIGLNTDSDNLFRHVRQFADGGMQIF
jgi:hypothetical protein